MIETRISRDILVAEDYSDGWILLHDECECSTVTLSVEEARAFKAYLDEFLDHQNLTINGESSQVRTAAPPLGSPLPPILVRLPGTSRP